MTQISISEWKKVPENAKLRYLLLGKLKRTVDSPLKALSEFCHCASVLAGMRFKAVIRSGKFKGWLGYSGINLEMPVRCSVGIYVASNPTMSTNLMRIALLAEALGISSGCYLIFEDSGGIGSEDVPAGQKKPFHRIDDDRVVSMKPLALVLGARRISVCSWNECIPEYVRYVQTSVPFGERLAPSMPTGYEKFGAVECVHAMKQLIEASGLDRYSVCVEYVAETMPVQASAADCSSTGDGRVEADAAASHKELIVTTSCHHRRFAPVAAIW